MKVQDPSLARALGPVASCVQECRRLGHLPDGRLHVGVSGGADSTLLFLLLERLRRRLGLKLSIGHVDHGLRPASGAEAKWVEQLARRHDVPFRLERLELEPGPDLAQRARMARQRALQVQASELGALAIALAHTATDQVETMLMHATRGAGLLGLGGMSSWRAPFLRPLLHLSRAEVQNLAYRCTTGFLQDPSNEDPRHPRVLLRSEVIPALRALNPKADAAWVRLAQQARDAHEAIEAWARRESQGRRIQPGQIDLRDLDLLPRAVSQQMLLALLVEAGICVSELRHEVLRKICEAARYRAALAARRCPRPAGGLGPVRFDLHPQGHLTVQKTKLSIFLRARR